MPVQRRWRRDGPRASSDPPSVPPGASGSRFRRSGARICPDLGSGNLEAARAPRPEQPVPRPERALSEPAPDPDNDGPSP